MMIVKDCAECGDPLPDNHPRRKFCGITCRDNSHRPTAKKRKKYDPKTNPIIAAGTLRACIECGDAMTPKRSANPQAKYCSKSCSGKANQRRFYDNHPEKGRQRPEAKMERVLEETAYEPQNRRKGTTYTKLVDLGLADRIMEHETTATHAADLIGVTVAAVSRAMGTYRHEMEREQAGIDWEMEDWYSDMLPIDEISQLRRMKPDPESQIQKELLNIVYDSFWRFEHQFVTIGSMQASFLVKPFHEEIIEEMVKAFVWGLRLLVLTPPRHGKSELMIRFVAWIILMYPNIQILWVAANTDLAAQMTSKLKGIFEHNEALIKAFLPPGKKFGDNGCKIWRENSFTLYTRTDHTLKSPTFTGLGSTSTVAGRDVDFGVVDDLEERKTVETFELRVKSRKKHAEIMERKEKHTGMVTIASRQHLDDIPNHLMDETGTKAWTILVYPAHDEIGCLHDPEIDELHIDCMLMPEINDYEWLMEARDEAEALGLPGRYPLRYLQAAVPIEGVIFDIPLIKKKCLDRSRGLGMAELPNMRLIAGLDPAPRGTQVAFLWGWTPEMLYLVDIELQQGGGVIGAMDVMERWHIAYGLDLWIHEDNSGQIDAWEEVERFQELKRDLGIFVKPHTTGRNKHDPEFGISSMAPWYHDGRINLPYGTGAARRVVNVLLRQLQLWTSDGLAKRGKTDAKMASWLPFPRIQKWGRKAQQPEIVLTSDQSFPNIGSEMNSAPWTTLYPGAM